MSHTLLVRLLNDTVSLTLKKSQTYDLANDLGIHPNEMKTVHSSGSLYINVYSNIIHTS